MCGRSILAGRGVGNFVIAQEQQACGAGGVVAFGEAAADGGRGCAAEGKVISLGKEDREDGERNAPCDKAQLTAMLFDAGKVGAPGQDAAERDVEQAQDRPPRGDQHRTAAYFLVNKRNC